MSVRGDREELVTDKKTLSCSDQSQELSWCAVGNMSHVVSSHRGTSESLPGPKGRMHDTSRGDEDRQVSCPNSRELSH